MNIFKNFIASLAASTVIWAVYYPQFIILASNIAPIGIQYLLKDKEESNKDSKEDSKEDSK